LQALMSPAPSPESYYQRLLEAARDRGLQEPQLLLGLLWHAPLGDARERPQGWKYLQQLLNQGVFTREFNREWPNDDESRQSSRAGSQIQTISEKPVRLVDSLQSSQPVARDYSNKSSSEHAAISSDWLDDEKPSQSQKPRSPQNGNGGLGDNWQEFFRASQENLIVERHRYEAMIYELGKLRVWQEICKQERRDNKRLSMKLEAQLAQEVEYLRHLLMKKS
jgi:hypothetical protein